MKVAKVWDTIDLPSYLCSPQHSDVIIIASDGKVSAHKLVLGASCKLLRLALLDPQIESASDPVIFLPDFSIFEIRQFLHILYGRHDSSPLSASTIQLLRECGFPTKLEDFEKTGCGGGGADEVQEVNVKVECDVFDTEYWEDDSEEEEEEEVEVEEPMDDDSDGDESADSMDNRRKRRMTRSTRKNDLAKKKVTFVVNSEGQFQCPENDCSHTSDTKSGMQLHSKSHFKDPCTCPQCDKVVSKESMARHVARKHHVKKSACTYCGKIMVSQYIARHIAQKHRDVQEADVECMECRLEFDSVAKLDKHVEKLHKKSGGGVACRKCSYCDKKFGAPERLEEHEFQCMPLPSPQQKGKFSNRRKHAPTANIKVPIREDRPDQCPHQDCNYKHVKPGRIRNHYLTKHCRQRCPFCEKILSALHMERHVMMNHTKQFNFVCDMCSKGFFKQRDLTNHIDEEHVKELKHVCDLCGKGFFSHGKLYAHKYRAHVRNDWRCDPCGKKYTNQGSLIKHLKRYHNGEGIDKLFQDEAGTFKQVRNYRHIPDKAMASAVDALILDQSTLEPYLPPKEEAVAASVSGDKPM